MLRRLIEARRRAGSDDNSNLSNSGRISETDGSTSVGGSSASNIGGCANNDSTEPSTTAAAPSTAPIPSKPSFVIRASSSPTNFRKKYWTSKAESWNADERLRELVANTTRVEELKCFDACIEASDAMASISTSSGRVDDATGLVDCSVLVSADGELLLIPQDQQTKEAKRLSLEAAMAASPASKRRLIREEEERFLDHARGFWNHERQPNDLGVEYQSAVFLGNDLYNHGDEVLNGFSAKGWSVTAASLAMKQSANAVGDFAEFVEELVLTKKSCAAQENQMINKLRDMVEESAARGKLIEYQRYLHESFPDDNLVLDVLPARVGPLLSPGGTLQATMVALENYYSTLAESDSSLWRKITLQSGALTQLQSAKHQTDDRVKSRQIALQEMMRRVKAMEEHLVRCKDDARLKWDQVHEAEMRVSQMVEEKMMERSRLREQQRLERIKQNEATRAKEAAEGNRGTMSSSEIWDMVSAVTASMDEGSFEPIDIPHPQATVSRDKSWSDSEPGDEISELPRSTSMDEDDSELVKQHIPMTSRYDLEEECGLPEIRSAALAADEAVEDAANSLLSVLSNWDTTSRSARLAAETCLISASNAQASCLRSIIALERESITERLRLLEEVENVAKNIDVRADMNRYIASDKQKPGGQSFLGEDDDGGVASALAVLHTHADGDIGMANPTNYRASHLNDSGQELDGEDESSITPEYLEEAVDVFFRADPLLLAGAAGSGKTENAQEELRAIVEKLCTIGRDKSPNARSRRSTICYSINAKRNSHAKIPSAVQFHGLCRVFSETLSGCSMDSSGVANAKLLMNLSQNFYCREKDADGKGRDVYLKSHLADHPLWQRDDFWDEALHQIVAESITHSGVIANIEGPSSRMVTATTKKRSEWTETYTTKWHDLKEAERYQAASQVHAVVSAQLGAMCHSMMEFGCGLERTSAFVRRMSIRNQLPVSQRTALLRHLIGRDVEDGDVDIKKDG